MDSAAPSSATKAHKPSGAVACLCSPTTHPGSFRCKLHRGGGAAGRMINPGRPSAQTAAAEARAAAKVKSMKALLMQIICPSNHDAAGRRRDFQPKPSRFSLMNGRDVHGVPVN